MLSSSGCQSSISHAIPPAACSNIEFASLELHRFQGLLKFGPIELRAKFVWLGSCCRLSNFARNSPATCLDIEVVSLELQRFRVVSKSDRGKLCAKFVWRWPLQPMLAPSTGRLLRGLALRFLRCHPLRWGQVCCCVGSLDLCLAFGTKFSLLSVVLSKAVQNSPCMQKQRHIEPFLVSRKSFIPRMRRGRVCWESFVPRMRRGRVCWESFVPDMRRGRVCWESFVPKGRGVVVVGRIMSCSGVVLVPVGGLWRRPAAHGRCGRAFRVPRRSPGRWPVGVLRHAKPFCGVSPACRSLGWRNSPRLVAARPLFEAVWRPNRRPPR